MVSADIDSYPAELYPVRMKADVGLFLALVFLSVTAADANARKTFSLTVNLKGRFAPTVRVCTSVQTAEPFFVFVTNEEVRTVLSGELRHCDKQGCSLELAIEQGRGRAAVYDRGVYLVKLGTVVERPVSILTRNYEGTYDRDIILSNGACAGEEVDRGNDDTPAGSGGPDRIATPRVIRPE